MACAVQAADRFCADCSVPVAWQKYAFFVQDGEALPAWYHRVVTDLLQGGGDAQTIVQFGALFHLIDPLDGARSVTI